MKLNTCLLIVSRSMCLATPSVCLHGVVLSKAQGYLCLTLNETCNKVHIGKSLSRAFSVHNGLK
jgi:hypothetical protein